MMTFDHALSHNITCVISDEWIDLQLDFSGIEILAGTSQAFYIYSTGIVLTALPTTDTSLAEDTNVKVSKPSRAVGSLFGYWDYGTELSFVGTVIYSLDPPAPMPTQQPTPRPTMLPKVRKTQRPTINQNRRKE
jgi:hypothetical protein